MKGLRHVLYNYYPGGMYTTSRTPTQRGGVQGSHDTKMDRTTEQLASERARKSITNPLNELCWFVRAVWR